MEYLPALLSFTTILTTSIIVLTLVSAWRFINWVWLRPKKLERLLQRQGLRGNPYRVLHGDLKENERMFRDATSRPIGLSDDIVPRVYPFLHQSVKTFGKDSYMWMGPIPRVTIMGPEQLKDIFSKINDFEKPRMNPLVRLLADGLVVHNGEKWAKHRKILNPAFQQEKLKLMVPAFFSSCHRMVTAWEEAISTKEFIELDVWPDLQNLTRDVISRTAFGSSVEEGKRIFELQTELAEHVALALRKVYIPGWRFLPTKMNRKMKNLNKEIESLLRGIISRKEKAIRAGEAPSDDVLGLLLESNMREIQERRGNKNVGMSIEDVISECKLFYFAGQETTSILLVWTMLLLSIHPEWQERAREEVLQVFGRDEPEVDGLNRLKIVTMILNEVLRLYSPVVELLRTVREDTKLGDLCLPAGVEVVVPTVLIHHDQELWGDDANEFKPERFAEGILKATKNQASFFPFGWGPRICIGQNFSMIEAKMALALILQRFSFELSPLYAHAPTTRILVEPQHGVQVILRRREI